MYVHMYISYLYVYNFKQLFLSFITDLGLTLWNCNNVGKTEAGCDSCKLFHKFEESLIEFCRFPNQFCALGFLRNLHNKKIYSYEI